MFRMVSVKLAASSASASRVCVTSSTAAVYSAATEAERRVRKAVRSPGATPMASHRPASCPLVDAASDARSTVVAGCSIMGWRAGEGEEKSDRNYAGGG